MSSVKVVVEDEFGAQEWSRSILDNEPLNPEAMIQEAFPDEEFEEVSWKEEVNGLYDYCVIFYSDGTRHSSYGFNRVTEYD